MGYAVMRERVAEYGLTLWLSKLSLLNASAQCLVELVVECVGSSSGLVVGKNVLLES